MQIKFHLDEHMPSSVAKGLRELGIDVTTTPEEGMLGYPDPDQFGYCTSVGRVLATRDKDFLRIARATAHHAGLVYSKPGTRSAAEFLDYLTVVHGCLTAEEMQDQIQYC